MTSYGNIGRRANKKCEHIVVNTSVLKTIENLSDFIVSKEVDNYGEKVYVHDMPFISSLHRKLQLRLREAPPKSKLYLLLSEQ